nr:hypothetical protein pPsy0462a_00004 [Pseudomonas syringae]
MKLSVALIVLSLASVCLGEAGLRTGDLAYIQAGTLALVFAFFPDARNHRTRNCCVAARKSH